MSTAPVNSVVMPGKRRARARCEGKGPRWSNALSPTECLHFDSPMRKHLYYVYILASHRNDTLCVGVSRSACSDHAEIDFFRTHIQLKS